MKAAECSIWLVWGGLFTGSDFAELEPGAEEFYGPFHTEQEALRAWKVATMRKVDVANHRLLIMLAQPVSVHAEVL